MKQMISDNPLWQFEVQLYQPGELNGAAFSLSVTKEFLEAELKFMETASIPELRAAARQVSKEAGYETGFDLLMFAADRSTRLREIHIGFNGCSLTVEENGLYKSRIGYATHNTNTQYKKKILVSLWSWWVRCVEESRVVPAEKFVCNCFQV